MFEDNAQPTQAQNPAPAQSAPNKAVEDIFADTDSAASQSAQISSIQPGPPTALTSGKLKPLAQTAGQAVPQGQVSGAEEAGFPFKTLGIIIGVVFVISAIGASAYFVFKSRLPQDEEQNAGTQQNTAKNAETNPAQDQNTADTQQEQNIGAETESDASATDTKNTSAGFIDSFKQTQQDKALNPISKDLSSKDTDQDGLTDAKEFDIGTNYRLVDSDNDGLSDWEEFSIFGTDPLDKDSDGDGYLDGEEVQNGYNPLGAGKLLDFEKAE